MITVTVQASAKVLNIFRRYSKLCERASIDEAYLDVSEQVNEYTS